MQTCNETRIRGAALLLLALGLTGCDSSPPPAQVQPATGDAALTQPFGEDSGKPWPHLPEDGSGVQVSADLLTRNIYLVLDGSGSMHDAGCSGGMRKIDAAKQAVREFAGMVSADTNLGLLAFDRQGVSERAPLSKGSREALVRSVDQVQPEGGTPLLQAIGLAYQQLTRQGQSQLGYGEYHLVVVTDGLASQGQEPDSLVRQILDESPVVLHTIGFCIGQDHSLNQPGRVLYRAADDYAGLKAGLQGVLAESPEFVPTRFE
jgi:hypothetical protein